MDIVMDNYIIWIIVAIVIILMTIIGYIAEKTDFGKKEFSKRGKFGKMKLKKAKGKSKGINEVEEKEAPVEDSNSLGQALENSEEKMEFQIPNSLTNENSNMKAGYTTPNISSLDQEWNLSSNNSIESNKTITPIEEDLNVPLNDTRKNEEISEEFNMPEPKKSPVIKRIEEDLNAPFGDDVQESKSSEESLVLPDIDSVKEEVPLNNEAEDDIWKF